MTETVRDYTELAPRRGFFRRLASGTMAVALAGLVPTTLRAEQGSELSDGPDWPSPLKGRHRQVVDAYAPNDGFPLAFAFSFLATNGLASATVVPATAVIVLRHTAFPVALGHEMWRKYKIGESLNITDPETKARRSKIHSSSPSRASSWSTIWRSTDCSRPAPLSARAILH